MKVWIHTARIGKPTRSYQEEVVELTELDWDEYEQVVAQGLMSLEQREIAWRTLARMKMGVAAGVFRTFRGYRGPNSSVACGMVPDPPVTDRLGAMILFRTLANCKGSK